MNDHAKPCPKEITDHATPGRPLVPKNVSASGDLPIVRMFLTFRIYLNRIRMWEPNYSDRPTELRHVPFDGEGNEHVLSHPPPRWLRALRAGQKRTSFVST